MREFLEKELSHNIERDWIERKLWPAKTEDIFYVLEQFCWNVKSKPFFNRINACNLIVNVYKHGKGSSLKRLHENYPQYLPHPFADAESESLASFVNLDHEWLEVSADDFDEFAKAIDDLWTQMPERSYLEVGG